MALWDCRRTKELSQLSLVIKRGDTRNGIKGTIKKNGETVNLDGCTVLFYMQGKIEGGYATVLEDGRVFHPLEADAVDRAGKFKAEFKVIYKDGRVDTFPSVGYIEIEIKQDLKG